MVTVWGKVITVGVHHHFKLTSVHCVKSTKKILAGVRPPLPLLGNARILIAFCTVTPPLLTYFAMQAKAVRCLASSNDHKVLWWLFWAKQIFKVKRQSIIFNSMMISHDHNHHDPLTSGKRMMTRRPRAMSIRARPRMARPAWEGRRGPASLLQTRWIRPSSEF